MNMVSHGEGLSGNQIKMLLILLMLFDHAAEILFNDYHTVNEIAAMSSRVVAPGMIFFLVEGYIHTTNLKKYVSRMALLAVISQFAFAYAFSVPLLPSSDSYFYQEVNVIWGLTWGLLTMAVLFTENRAVKTWMKVLFLIFAVIVAIPSDFMCVAVLVAPAMYLLRDNHWMKIGVLSVLSFAINFGCRLYWTGDWLMAVVMGSMVLLIIPLFCLYNGRRGDWKYMKWFYYVFYPVHLFVLGLIAHLM